MAVFYVLTTRRPTRASYTTSLDSTNVRYRTGWKGRWVQQLRDLVDERTPWLRIRYAF